MYKIYLLNQEKCFTDRPSFFNSVERTRRRESKEVAMVDPASDGNGEPPRLRNGSATAPHRLRRACGTADLVDPRR